MEPVFLDELSDVDEPADLAVWNAARQASRTLTVIVPALNEGEQLSLTLKHATSSQPVEIILADGGSGDDTLRIARSHGANVVNGAMGRARQMNAGAAVAGGETLLFLHADTLLPTDYRDQVLAALRQPEVVGGAFRFKVRDRFPGRWFVESTTDLRTRFWQMPYGDQALFVRRWVFDAVGGFPDLPIMEDYEFVRRLRRLGKLALLDAPALTSGRRWQRLGFLRATLINRAIIIGYRCGVSPARLASLYRGQPGRSQRGSAVGEPNPQTIRTDELV